MIASITKIGTIVLKYLFAQLLFNNAAKYLRIFLVIMGAPANVHSLA